MLNGSKQKKHHLYMYQDIPIRRGDTIHYLIFEMNLLQMSLFILTAQSIQVGGRRGRDLMVVEFTTTSTINAYLH